MNSRNREVLIRPFVPMDAVPGYEDAVRIMRLKGLGPVEMTVGPFKSGDQVTPVTFSGENFTALTRLLRVVGLLWEGDAEEFASLTRSGVLERRLEQEATNISRGLPRNPDWETSLREPVRRIEVIEG